MISYSYQYYLLNQVNCWIYSSICISIAVCFHIGRQLQSYSIACRHIQECIIIPSAPLHINDRDED